MNFNFNEIEEVARKNKQLNDELGILALRYCPVEEQYEIQINVHSFVEYAVNENLQVDNREYDDDYPYEVYFMKNGFKYFTVMTESEYEQHIDLIEKEIPSVEEVSPSRMLPSERALKDVGMSYKDFI